MAVLKGANTTIGADGVTVTTTTESEATARELASQLETQVRAREGGPGARFNNWLANSLNRFDETLGIYGDRSLQIIRDVLLVCAMALAVFAWSRVLPGYEILMCVIGAAIVFAMKTVAGKLDEANQAQDSALRAFYWVIIGAGLILEVVASASLQSFTAMEQQTGRNDIDASISRLTSERNMLQITLANVPTAPASAVAQQVEALKLTAAVNRNGTQLNKRVGDLVGDCTGASYYVTIYCPTLIELQAEYDKALAYEQAKARYDQISPEIDALAAKRPHTSSTFALADRATGGGTAWWISLIVPVGLSLILNIAMLVLAYLTGRAKRPPPAPAGATP